eukprot:7171859-Karenia_brevis.AAC.1
MASQKRVLTFAQYNHAQVLWMRATDIPKSDSLKGIRGEELEKRRLGWLQQHDQNTGGIMGLCPLTYNCPMRFTMTVDASRRIFKYTRCHLIGWELHDRDEERVTGCSEPEIVLERLPKR